MGVGHGVWWVGLLVWPKMGVDYLGLGMAMFRALVNQELRQIVARVEFLTRGLWGRRIALRLALPSTSEDLTSVVSMGDFGQSMEAATALS